MGSQGFPHGHILACTFLPYPPMLLQAQRGSFLSKIGDFKHFSGVIKVQKYYINIYIYICYIYIYIYICYVYVLLYVKYVIRVIYVLRTQLPFWLQVFITVFGQYNVITDEAQRVLILCTVEFNGILVVFDIAYHLSSEYRCYIGLSR